MLEENGIRVWFIIMMILTLMKYYDEQSLYLVYIYNSFVFNLFLIYSYFIYLCGYKV